LINDLQMAIVSADDTLAVVMLRPQFAQPPGEDVQLRGHVEGPFSPAARTLPARLQIAPQPATAPVVLHLVDPCFTTPEVPMEYELQLDLIDASQTRQRYNARIAFRRAAASSP